MTLMQNAGTLHLVGMPIGNLEDITLRALRVLREVDIIAAEDTRVTKVLLSRHEIRTPTLSYHGYSGPKRLTAILDLLREGKQVALVTDAGMPAISDPGSEIVRACAEAGLTVVTVPGPTAVATALALSGFLAQEYLFLGFLPNRAGPRREALRTTTNRAGAIVCYEAPHRLLETLEDMRTVLGDRQAACGRELTKLFEEVVRGTFSELIAHFSEHAPRGEMTVVVEGAPVEAEAPDLPAGVAEAKELIAAGMAPSRAVAHVAKWRHLPRRALYQAVLEEQDAPAGDAEDTGREG
jgi:16S rRNA (cytidine1402-2'-O)-methyltransferase